MRVAIPMYLKVLHFSALATLFHRRRRRLHHHHHHKDPSRVRSLKDFLQPRLIVPSKVFQVVFVHLIYNSALV
jgi:hypothetical protein